jgi:ABC-type sulfate transport system substrate-binding protein
MNTTTDVDFLASTGVVAEDWNKRFPTDRKSNSMGAIMTHVLGITGLPPGPA